MTSRERLTTIISGKEADRCGLWLGYPHPDTWPILLDYFKADNEEEVREMLDDDYRWLAPWDAYKHPEGKPVFDMQREGKELGAAGVFAECEDVQEVEDHEWPDPDYLDFTDIMDKLENAGDRYRASGFWCSFFHEVADFFGMENYFIKMYTNPDVIHAVTRHVVDYYLEANRRLFEAAGNLIDGFFFGNDFGSQLDLLASPECVKEFVFPYFKQLTDLGHKYGYQVILHSCGSIYRVIPDLIELGVNALHPLQAKAANMDAETLAREFKGKIAFIGGIDTQHLLVHGTPEEVKEDLRRVKELLGPCLIVSPSHEAVLPNVPPQNIEALAQAALE
jgi:uroporphyrinogen decarboxylase